MIVIDIAFDLDGVLVDIIPTLDQILFEKHKAKLKPVNEWKLYTEPHLEDDVIWECIQETYKHYETFELYEGAKELLYILWKLSDNDPIKIITARPPKTAGNVTYKLISERLCDYPYELVMTSEHDKLPYLNRYNYMVEDRRANAIHYANHGKKVFLVDRKYNQMNDDYLYPNITRIKGVHELIPIAHELIKGI